jgi:uncharacterized membrane protein
MSHTNPPAAVVLARHPVHAMLAPFPIVCFTLTLFTDIAYWQTSNLMWQHFSEWLLFAGIVFGVLAAIAGAVDFLFRREARASGGAWPHVLGSLLVLVLAFINSLVHSADGWTGVVPWGLILSAVTVLVLVVTNWFGRAMVYRHRAGVSNHA